MDEALPYVLGTGFFLVAATIFGSMIFAVARLQAQEKTSGGAATVRMATEAAKGRAGRRPWGTAALIVGTVVALGALVAYQLTPPTVPLVIKVTAYQFGWKFDYYRTVEAGTPGAVAVRDTRGVQGLDLQVVALELTTSDQVTVPKGTPVLFLATSLDVIHRFSAPELLVRRDVVPDQVTSIWVEPRHTGRFRIESDYLCGAGDGVMLAALDVVEPAVFETWLSEAPRRSAGDDLENRE